MKAMLTAVAMMVVLSACGSMDEKDNMSGDMMHDAKSDSMSHDKMMEDKKMKKDSMMKETM